MLYKVSNICDNKFQFNCEGTNYKKKKVFLLKNPSEKPEIELITTNKEKFVIDIEELNFRPYFAIEIDDKIVITAERTLPVEGMNNFRDMGGYETYDGHTVEWGKLFRSDHIYNATENGINYLKKLNINTIIDYRSDNERDKYPNTFINDKIVTYVLDPDAHTAELAAQFTSSKDNEDENLVNKIIDQKEKGQLIDRYDIVMEQYNNFVNKEESKKAFSEMIKIAANPEAPAIIQHCRGGKDRTGFGAILLLGLLGVKKEYLIYDYMLTHYNRESRNKTKMEIYRKFTSDQVVLDYLYSLIDSRPEFIEASYDAIIKKYSSIENYAIKELHINEDEIEKIRSLYLK